MMLIDARALAHNDNAAQKIAARVLERSDQIIRHSRRRISW